MKNDTESRGFKGVWISKEIWLDKKMTWMEKLLLTEINSLDNEDGCFASNNYFAEFFNLSAGRISQIISSLKKKGFVSCEYIRDGKEIKKRIVRILNTGIKNTKGGIKNTKEGYLENDKGNNTVSNNTVNNTKALAPKAPDWKKDLHKKIRAHFELCSEKLECKYYHSAKEAGSVNNIIQRAMSMAEKDHIKAEKIIYEKLKILYNRISDPDDNFWADKTYCPSSLISHWNNLNRERAVKSKSAKSLEKTMQSILGGNKL